MNTPFDPKTGNWKIRWPGRVAKHDLVYLSPPEDPMQGIALGNGDVGVLCWCEGSRLYFAVNKCDLWDDAEFEQFENWKPEQEEISTTLRHGCRLIVDFQMPVFDLFYLSDFQGRLSLADATMTLKASGPFGTVSVKAFVGHSDGVLHCEIRNALKENPGTIIDVERFGSRTFAHWYSLIKRDATCGLAGTRASVDRDGMYITHQLTSGRFAAGVNLAAASGTKPKCSCLHSHAARMVITPRPDERLELKLGITPPIADNPIKTVKRILKDSSGDARLHKKAWKQFWLRSLMENGDDYLDNLWHLAMYYANSCQGGKYPGRFINGLWTWNRDTQPWNFYFHWNQQELYWPLNAAGHHDLIKPYLDYRFNALDYAKKDAKELFDVEGAFVSDVCDRRGFNSKAESLNHTPVAQIALDFWRQYQFTGDKEFLDTQALPYMIEACKFMESLFEKGNDGKYHAKRGTGYEGWVELKDSITELSYGKSLFEATIAACVQADVDEPSTARWQEIVSNLAPWPRMKMDSEMLDKESKTFARGVFKGNRPACDEILAVGYGIKEDRLLSSMVPTTAEPQEQDDLHDTILKREIGRKRPPLGGDENWENYQGIFPWAELSSVFPAGPLGLSAKGTDYFKAAVNTAKLYTPELTGWSPIPIFLARLGLGREVHDVLKEYPDRWQIYINGWTHWGVRENIKADATLRFDTNLVRDAALKWPEIDKDENKLPLPVWPFRHTSLEAMFVLACTMNESLLQSHDGVIRIAPAAYRKQDARFTLHAVGGFIVSAEINNGTPQWIAIQSQKGGICRIANPWKKSFVFCEGDKVSESTSRVIEMPTRKRQVLLFVPDEKAIAAWKTQEATHARNKHPKASASGLARLGLPRSF